jgi:hypothetical protein
MTNYIHNIHSQNKKNDDIKSSSVQWVGSSDLSSSQTGCFHLMACSTPQFKPILLCVHSFLHNNCSYLPLALIEDKFRCWIIFKLEFMYEYGSNRLQFGSGIMDNDLVK